MSNDLAAFNDILYTHLRPWKVNYSSQKYQQLHRELKRDSYQFQPLYDIAFIKPVNEKRKFYHALITNEAINFLNYIHDQIETAQSEKEGKYWVRSALDKKLKPKFKELKNIIEQKQYHLNHINLDNDDAFVIQFLKYQVIRLYLEIQDHYKHHLEDEPLSEEDIHLNFFSDPASDKQIIVEAEKLNLPKRNVLSTPKPPAPKFVQYNHEIRDPEDGILAYEEIVAKPERLGRIEEILFEDKYIDENLKFIKQKGNKLVIAAVAQVLRHNKFFNAIAFHNGKKIKVTDRHIQQFFSHRYMTNIDQEFRRFREEEKLQEFLSNNNWIKLLPSS